MPAEEIEIQFRADQEFFAEMDRRFGGLADRFIGRLSSGARGLGGGQAGQTPGGGAGAGAAEGTGFAAGLAAGLAPLVAGIGGAGQALRSTPPGGMLFGPGGFQSQNVTPTLQRGAVGYLGGMLEDTVGKIPGLGDIVMAQFNSYKEAFFAPQERAAARLKGTYGTLAAGGFQASREELDAAARFALPIEERRMWMERQVDSVVSSVDAPRAVERGLNSVGLGSQ